jgi:hypothetical protein
MKKQFFTRTLALLLALLLVAVAFVGCKQEEKSENGFCTVVLEGDPAVEYRVNLDKVTGTNGLLSVLEYLKETEGVSYTENGGMLSEVGSVKEDAAAGKYVYLWTSVEKDFDVSVYASTKTYGQLTLTSSGVGAKDMTVTDGAVIYIGLYSFT